MTTWKIFQGNGTPHDGLQRLPDAPNWRRFKDKQSRQQQKGSTFIARPEEIDLVNAALYLRRPLLVTGKPGTGKTSLAYAVAYELKLDEVLYWPITTRTTLKDGLYSYDAIGRLQDLQQKNQAGQDLPPENKEKQEEQESQTKRENLEEIGKYIRLGPLGTALLPPQDPKKPRILLIDEIDKSDIDLPNDLLHVFEEGRFRIDELFRIKKIINEVEVGTAYEEQETAVKIEGGQVQATTFPFVILTSNGERDFPPPFLRRCIRLQMREPDRKELAGIIESHLGTDAMEEAQPLLEQFLDLRDKQGKDLATDQLLNAIYLLLQKDLPTDKERDALLKKILKPLSGTEAV